MADIRHANKNGREVLTISGVLTVKHAKALQAAILEAVRNASAVDLEVEHISDLDVTFAQLVCSAHRMAADLKADNDHRSRAGAVQPDARPCRVLPPYRLSGEHEEVLSVAARPGGPRRQARPTENGVNNHE